MTDAARRYQLDAAWALVRMLDKDLPAAVWTLHDDYGTYTAANDTDYLFGSLPPDSPQGLLAWAEAFGAEVDWQSHNGQRANVRFRVGGVAVRVHTVLSETGGDSQ